MRCQCRCASLAFLLLLILPWASAQDKTVNPVEIHKNVFLAAALPPADMQKELADDYTKFLPIFQDVIKEDLTDQPTECTLNIRVSAEVKELGAAKTPRAFAYISAFRKNSRSEYVGNLLLYDYVTSGLIGKEEIDRFVKRVILGAAECQSPND